MTSLGASGLTSGGCVSTSPMLGMQWSPSPSFSYCAFSLPSPPTSSSHMSPPAPTTWWSTSLTSASSLSYLCLRRFLFLDKLVGESERVWEGYMDQLNHSFHLLSIFVMSCFMGKVAYKVWWYSSGSKRVSFVVTGVTHQLQSACHHGAACHRERHPLRSRQVPPYLVSHLPCEEAGGEGEGELDHHVIGAVGGGAGEDEVGGCGDEDAQDEEEGPGDHCMPSVELVDAHPLKARPEALEFVVGEAVCV